MNLANTYHMFLQHMVGIRYHMFLQPDVHMPLQVSSIQVASLTGDINCQPVWIYVFQF